MMRRNIAVARSLSGGLLLFVFLSASPSVWAESFLDSLADHPLHTIRDADNTISLAATGTLQNYQENLPSPSDTESGWMPGVRLGISGLNPQGDTSASLLYFALHYGYESGNLRYQGANLITHQPLDLTDHSQMQTVSVRIGKGLRVSRQVLLIPYFQYRFIDWQRHLSSAAGQYERYETNSAGLGLLAQWSPASRWVWTGRLAWAEGFSGTVQGVHGIIAPAVPLHPGATLQAGIQVDYRIRGPWHVFGGLRFTHYAFDGSPPFVGILVAPSGLRHYAILHEPSSQTNRFTALIGLAYHFA